MSCLVFFIRVVRQLGLFVGSIHSQLVQIWLSMKAHIFERACPLYQDGR
jgi:hypothetical protein